MNIGENIKKIRIDKGLTRQDLAKKIHVSDSTISRYENNKRVPNIETLNKIAEALSVQTSDILDWDCLTENEAHLEISKLVSGDSSGSKKYQLESKISYSLISIITFAMDLYGEDLFRNNNINFLDSEDYQELLYNIMDLVENKINKLITLKTDNK